MIDDHSEVWFLTGSQHLYGEKVLVQVQEHSAEISRSLGHAKLLPVKLVLKPVLTNPDAITRICLEANSADNCIGVITWMHTFSPAKMWIAGLTRLTKPLLHLHTQYNQDLPWSSIDMDFMNLNQSAHGDREFGFIGARLRLSRKVVVGHWKDADVIESIAVWTRAAAAWNDAHALKVARFGDNMREVAVTEGDKVAAQTVLGWSVNGYGTGDLVESIDACTDAEVDELVAVYDQSYEVAETLKLNGKHRQALRDSARIELGIRKFLDGGGFRAFTDIFQDLHGLMQLPGVAAQRIMADGYGFGGEGDWKTAALVRALKVMGHGLPGGTSFMEDYTYHLGRNPKVLGAHMLEVCPSITSERPTLEIHPLSIGGKADPVRLVFTAREGPAINVSIVDLGNRFRMIVNEIDVVRPDEPLPMLPVARAIWVPKPNLKIAAASWIYAGGAHHTVFSQAVTTDHLQDFADIAGIEIIRIDARTEIQRFRDELRWNETYYCLRNPF